MLVTNRSKGFEAIYTSAFMQQMRGKCTEYILLVLVIWARTLAMANGKYQVYIMYMMLFTQDDYQWWGSSERRSASFSTPHPSCYVATLHKVGHVHTVYIHFSMVMLWRDIYWDLYRFGTLPRLCNELALQMNVFQIWPKHSESIANMNSNNRTISYTMVS